MMLLWIVPLVLVLLLWDRPVRRSNSTPWFFIVAMLLVLPGLGMAWMSSGMHAFSYGLPGWAWAVGMLLFLAALGISGYFALRQGVRESEELQILKLRLARGEITAEEYDLLRQKLSS